MYSLFGISQNIKNVFRLSVNYSNGQDIRHTDDLSISYRNFLEEHQKNYPVGRGNKSQIVKNAKDYAAFRQAYSESSLNDLEQEQMLSAEFAEDSIAERAQRIEEALEHLATVCPELSQLFHLVIHSIIISDSRKNKTGLNAHGGTSSKCVGVMWLTLKPELSKNDIVEMLIHELTHTLVFLDELNNQHFNYKNISKEFTWAQSAILNRLRPMDKVVHSIVVSAEVLLARSRFLKSNHSEISVHPSCEKLKQSTLTAIESVLEHKNLQDICLPRSVKLVSQAKSAILNIDKKETLEKRNRYEELLQ